MRTQRIVLALVLFVVLVGVCSSTGAVRAETRGDVLEANAQTMPLQFRAANHILGFTSTQVYLSGLDHMLRIEFPGGRGVTPQTGTPLVRAGTEAAALSSVLYRNVWDGIDVSFRADKNGGIAKSEYIVAPFADASQIRLHYSAQTELQADGSLRLTPPNGSGYFSESAPVAWQEIDGQRVAVRAAFVVDSDILALHMGRYDPRYALVIDPIYVWHTFYGGTHSLIGGVALDHENNVYVAGRSNANWKGDDDAEPLHAYQSDDAIVLKLDSNGHYLWHTFYGAAEGIDFTSGIAFDADDNVYVTGTSETGWNGDGDTPPLHPHSGAMTVSMFLLKLDRNGRYQWHTFYGPLIWQSGSGVAISNEGYINIVGSSGEAWLGDNDAQPLHPHSGDEPGMIPQGDYYVIQLDLNGGYRWHTFYGGRSQGDGGTACAVDASGNIYLAGESWGSWQGDGDAAPLHPFSGASDIAILKLNSQGAFQWHTFYGSVNSREEGSGLTLDSNNNVYVSSGGAFSWLGDGGTAPLHAFNDIDDIEVIKLNSDGAYQWHTFYGSPQMDFGFGIASNGTEVFVTGFSDGAWLGSESQEPRNPFNPANNSHNITTLALDSSGAYQWHAFYGFDHIGWSITANSQNKVVVGVGGDGWTGDNGVEPLHASGGLGIIEFGPPIPPTPIKPERNAVLAKKRPVLDWSDTLYTTQYRVEMRRDSKSGSTLLQSNSEESRFRAPSLKRGVKYFWRVQACNELGCSAWSRWWNFERKGK